MRRAWRCPACQAELGSIIRDNAGNTTLQVWTNVGATVRPKSGEFEVTCKCGRVRTFVGGWVSFARRRNAT